MRIAAAVAVLIIAGSPAQADWQSVAAAAAPGNFPLPKPLRATYRFGWMGFTAGSAEAIFSKKSDQLQLDVKGGTTGFVRTLWSLDATHHARASASSLRPISLRQWEVYPWQTIRTEVDFSADGVQRFRESKPADKTPPRRKRFTFPNLYDLHTALLFFRSQRLQPGDIYSIVVYPAADAYLATLRVVGREKTQVPAGAFNAIKTELKLQKVNRDLTIVPHPKFRRAQAWISDDADRLLLKAQADIFVGSVWMELNQAQFRGR